MSKTLEVLREDHRNFERILDLLEIEVEIFRQAEQPDYGLIEAIVSYFTGYPDTAHHPVEDIIIVRLGKRNPQAAADIGDLEREHEKEKGRLALLVSVLDDVLRDQEIPREALISAASAFIRHLRHHMKMEEERFFAVAEIHLLPEDWVELDDRLTDDTDPVFRGSHVAEFVSLRDQILTWAQMEGN